jgi:hypothetical protein
MSAPAMAGALLIVAACAREAAEDRLVHRTDEAVPQTMCELKPGDKCGSGTLPRLSERSWSPAELGAFFARAAYGTTAVAMFDGKTRLVPDCKLPGKYLEVAGKPGRGRLWTATAGGVFFPEELPAPCMEATHVVLDYVSRDSRFAAILVPLPCPVSFDPTPAKGCIARGATGRERRARARTLAERFPLHEHAANDSGRLMEVFALASDDVGYGYLNHIEDDCSFRQQRSKATERHVEFGLQSRSVSVDDHPFYYPQFSETRLHCSASPPFLDCFPGLFEPAPGYSPGCWTAAKVNKP